MWTLSSVYTFIVGLGLECALLHCDLIRRDCDVDAIDVIDLDVAIELLMPYTWI